MTGFPKIGLWNLLWNSQQKQLGFFLYFSRLFIMNNRVSSQQIKKTFTLNAGRERECKQNIRMSKDCQRVLELY